jgi:hypothetical protein
MYAGNPCPLLKALSRYAPTFKESPSFAPCDRFCWTSRRWLAILTGLVDSYGIFLLLQMNAWIHVLPASWLGP